MTPIIVSTKKNSPYNVQDTEMLACEVFLDGVKLKYCVFADEAKGVATVVIQPWTKDDHGDFAEETLKGKITITGATESQRVDHMKTAKTFIDAQK